MNVPIDMTIGDIINHTTSGTHDNSAEQKINE
jgi:hypothetical protein